MVTLAIFNDDTSLHKKYNTIQLKQIVVASVSIALILLPCTHAFIRIKLFNILLMQLSKEENKNANKQKIYTTTLSEAITNVCNI